MQTHDAAVRDQKSPPASTRHPSHPDRVAGGISVSRLGALQLAIDESPRMRSQRRAIAPVVAQRAGEEGEQPLFDRVGTLITQALLLGSAVSTAVDEWREEEDQKDHHVQATGVLTMLAAVSLGMLSLKRHLMILHTQHRLYNEDRNQYSAVIWYREVAALGSLAAALIAGTVLWAGFSAPWTAGAVVVSAFSAGDLLEGLNLFLGYALNYCLRRRGIALATETTALIQTPQEADNANL